MVNSEELRTLLVTKKSSNLLRKKCYALFHLTQCKSTLVNREMSTVSQDFLS